MVDRKLSCSIVTPEKIIFEGDIDMLIAPGTEGELGILPLHIPLVTTLEIGELRLKYNDKLDSIAIDGGFLEVREDKVTILSESAIIASEIDVEVARKMAQKAEAALSSSEEKSTEFEKAKHDLERALNRLRIAESKSKEI